MFPLTPVVGASAAALVKDTELIQDLLQKHGSPLNVVLPQVVTQNYQSFVDVFARNQIKGDVYYAQKANKSYAILAELAAIGAKVDVASSHELSEALDAGFTADRIEATGPKNAEFVQQVVEHGVVVNINSIDELKRVAERVDQLSSSREVSIFLRIKEFTSTATQSIQKDSKFGLNLNEVDNALQIIEMTQSLCFKGFSFHLTTASAREKISAIHQLLHLTTEAIERGLEPDSINIGGGFAVNYLVNRAEWDQYISAIKRSLLDHDHVAMDWSRQGLGYRSEGGVIKGTPRFSDFYNEADQFNSLQELLDTKMPGFGSLKDFLQDNMINLCIEPGRALLDQAGLTLTRVDSTNTSLHGEKVIFTDMNRTNLNAIEMEFMSDPLVVSQSDNPELATEGVFISGNLCLPQDFICHRKVFLPQTVASGDVLVFINTAGYFMDFIESATIKHPTAKKIAWSNGCYCSDESYQPSNKQGV